MSISIIHQTTSTETDKTNNSTDQNVTKSKKFNVEYAVKTFNDKNANNIQILNIKEFISLQLSRNHARNSSDVPAPTTKTTTARPTIITKEYFERPVNLSSKMLKDGVNITSSITHFQDGLKRRSNITGHGYYMKTKPFVVSSSFKISNGSGATSSYTIRTVQNSEKLESTSLKKSAKVDDDAVFDIPEQSEIDDAVDHGLKKMRELYFVKEPLLYKMGLFLDKDDPASRVAAFGAPAEQAVHISRYGYAALQARLKLAERYPTPNGRQNSGQNPIFRADILTSQCPLRGTPRCSPATKRYRTADGTCNNLEHPWWGASMLPMQRFLPPHFDDGIQSVKTSVLGSHLPSPRDISVRIHRDRNVEMPTVTLMLMQWGQFIDHDITSTVQARSFNGSVPRCCLRGGRGFLPEEFLHPDCLPIAVSKDDWFYSKFGVRCLEFIRSAPTSRIDCDLGWREQINQVTSYLDASMVYGSDPQKADSLRLFRRGLLIYGRSRNSGPLLPPDPPGGELCRSGALTTSCFRAGDGRFGVQPGLTAFHTVFVRYHNHIADRLSQLNEHWSDEKVYQESRRIVAALVQHVTYREFLPIILGQEVMDLFDISLSRKGYYKGYDTRLNPAPANSFSSAAFRFGHSLVQKSFIRTDEFHRIIRNNVTIHEEQENIENIWSQGSIDRLLLGFSNQPSQRRDEFITEELTNHLFQGPNSPFGLDLAAINIQRGRDHGIPSYTNWREPCGLTPIKDWNDVARVTSEETAKRLRSLYVHVDDIDLYTGGLSEKPVRGGIVGPTFACIIAQQFANLRKGDRFWYENGGFESSFTPAQLQQIRKVTFAQIICQSMTEVETIQPFVFLSSDEFRNKRLSCQDPILDSLNLSPWAEVAKLGPHVFEEFVSQNEEDFGHRGTPLKINDQIAEFKSVDSTNHSGIPLEDLDDPQSEEIDIGLKESVKKMAKNFDIDATIRINSSLNRYLLEHLERQHHFQPRPVHKRSLDFHELGQKFSSEANLQKIELIERDRHDDDSKRTDRQTNQKNNGLFIKIPQLNFEVFKKKLSAENTNHDERTDIKDIKFIIPCRDILENFQNDYTDTKNYVRIDHNLDHKSPFVKLDTLSNKQTKRYRRQTFADMLEELRRRVQDKKVKTTTTDSILTKNDGLKTVTKMENDKIEDSDTLKTRYDPLDITGEDVEGRRRASTKKRKKIKPSTPKPTTTSPRVTIRSTRKIISKQNVTLVHKSQPSDMIKIKLTNITKATINLSNKYQDGTNNEDGEVYITQKPAQFEKYYYSTTPKPIFGYTTAPNDIFVLHPTTYDKPNQDVTYLYGSSIKSTTNPPDYHVNINIQYVLPTTQKTKRKSTKRTTTQSYYYETPKPIKKVKPIPTTMRPTTINSYPIFVQNPISTQRPTYLIRPSSNYNHEMTTKKTYNIRPSHGNNYQYHSQNSGGYHSGFDDAPFSSSNGLYIYKPSDGHYVPMYHKPSTTRRPYPSYLYTNYKEKPEEPDPDEIYIGSSTASIQSLSNKPYFGPDDDSDHEYETQSQRPEKIFYVGNTMYKIPDLETIDDRLDLKAYQYRKRLPTRYNDQGEKNFVKISSVQGDKFLSFDQKFTHISAQQKNDEIDLDNLEGVTTEDLNDRTADLLQVDVIPSEIRRNKWLLYDEKADDVNQDIPRVEINGNISTTNEIPTPMKFNLTERTNVTLDKNKTTND